MYVCIIINYCTCKHICGDVARGQGALTLLEHLVPPSYYRFTFEGSTLLSCTVSLTDLVHSYLDLRY